jgi:hypothetical protein
MVQIINGLPNTVAGFRATGKITQSDYDHVINPKVAEVYKQFDKINYLFVIETPLSNFSAGAWIKDAIVGFVYFTQFNKIAIVSKQENVKKFTDFFGKFVPGKSRGFMSEDLEKAMRWVAE